MRQLAEEARRFETALEEERASRVAEVKTQPACAVAVSLSCSNQLLFSTRLSTVQTAKVYPRSTTFRHRRGDVDDFPSSKARPLQGTYCELSDLQRENMDVHG